MDIAREHIETIRHDLLGGPSSDPNSRLFSVLTGALEIISKKVHHKDCHFLNELIQNFDDTGYEEVDEPTVKFTLTDTHFFAWSNENGFKREDVDSLCAIGRSSKASDLESTGENGIGFKSIFKVADQVTIQSHPYYFTFDTASELGQLGMLVPTWVDQPTDPNHGTLLTIRLKNQNKIRRALSDQLKNFNFYSLLFSRVLRKIKIDHRVQGSFTTTEASFRGHSESTTELVVERSHGARTIESFLIWNHSAKSKTRVDTRKWPTNIRLAFPIVGRDDEGPHRKHQQSYLTYAFQAIQDFGFSFMIHSDFILDASRSHVEPDQAWNIELESHISASIVEALAWLARDTKSPIPLEWPLYLKCLGQVHDRYFQRITSKVKKELRSLELVRTDLETFAGVTRQICRPPEAIIVDSRFRHDGRPLLDHPDDLSTFVSSEYSLQALDNLKILGVDWMDYYCFSQRFANMVNRHPAYIRRKSSQWHSAVATVLLRHPSYLHLNQVLESSAIVPLNDGTWMVPSPENAFLPNEAAPPIPSGFSICTVASEANEDTSRRRLFEVLGLRKCDFSDVHRVILEKHQGNQVWSHAQLLEQAVYLFLTRYKPRDLPFTFINSRDLPISSELVFLSESKAASLRPLFEADRSISWLHEDYYSPPTIDENLRVSWWRWLRQWKNILNDVRVIGTNGQLSTAFKSLYDRCGSGKALNFLRQHSNLPLANSTWCKNVGELGVSTTHGPRKLRETALPILHEKAGGMVPLISLESLEADWSFLKHFGVCVSVDRRFLFYQLSYLKANKHVTDLLASAKKIYYRLGKLIADDLEISKIRDAFGAAELILAQDGKWYYAHKVRWDSKFNCTLYPLLRDQYKPCRRLFCEVLDIRSTNLVDLMTEIRYQSEHISVKSKQNAILRTMRNLLQNLDSMLKIRPSSQEVSQLKTLEMFPIATHKGHWTLQSANSGEFWIPDISVLHECFRGHAPLLDLSDDAIGTNISNIVSVLGLRSKLLTEAVKYYYDGNTEEGREYPELEQDLKRKADYIGGILKGEGQSPEQITVRVNQVRNIKALQMPQIIIERYVVGKSRPYMGEKVEGGLRIITRGQQLLVLVHEDLKQDAMARLLRKEMARNLEVSQHSDLLGDLLAADDPESLLEDLQRAGAHQMHVADVPAGERTDASEEAGSDSDSDTDDSRNSNPETALEKSSNVRSDQQQRFPASPKGTHGGGSDVEDAQRQLNELRNGKSSEESSESTGYTICIERTSPTPIAATTTPSIRSTPKLSRGSLAKRWLTPADNSSVDFLASALAEVSVADDGPGTSISQDPPRFAGSATQMEDANPATRTPRQMTSREERNSPSPWQNLNGTNRRRLSGSLGQPVTPSAQVWRGSLQHLHQRSWNGGSSASQPGSSSERRKEIGRKGEHILYTFLRGKLGPSFGEKHWTSNGRKHYIPTCLDHDPSLCPPGCRNYYSIDEGGCADFTIGDSDASQAFTQYLRANWGWNRGVDSNTKYHLEVKSTPNRVENDAYWTLSANQIRMARQWSVDLVTASEPLRNVYVLVRVFDIDGEPRLWFVVDPWASMSLDLISEVAQRPAYTLESDNLELAVGDAQGSAHRIDLPAPESARGRRASGSFLSAVGQNAREGASDDPFEFTFAFPQSPSLQIAAAPTTICSSFEPFMERDPSGYSMAYQSIPFMDSFKHYSFEELRLADDEMESYISNVSRQQLEQAR